MDPLIDVESLRDRLGDPNLVVVDARWRLGDPGAGRGLYEQGHIPGAAFVDVDEDLADPPGDCGRHPLPATERFEAAMRRAGVSADSDVVAYDERGEGGAARLWWLLRHFGHERVAVLDGGLAGWREAGGPLSAGAEEAAEGDFGATPRLGDTVGAEDLGMPGRFVLLDARVPERYRGEVEPIDSAAGHIPGAVNLPFSEVAPGGVGSYGRAPRWNSSSSLWARTPTARRSPTAARASAPAS
jgi:thiosulfate/3-mercaptopyruvate sulfurtransferase